MLRATTARSFSCLIWPHGSAHAALAAYSSPLQSHKSLEKHDASRLSYSSFLWLSLFWSSFFHLSMLWEVWLLNFLRWGFNGIIASHVFGLCEKSNREILINHPVQRDDDRDFWTLLIKIQDSKKSNWWIQNAAEILQVMQQMAMQQQAMMQQQMQQQTPGDRWILRVFNNNWSGI